MALSIKQTDEWPLQRYKTWQTCGPESVLAQYLLTWRHQHRRVYGVFSICGQHHFWLLSSAEAVLISTPCIFYTLKTFVQTSICCCWEHIRVPGTSSSFSVLGSLMEQILQLPVKENQTRQALQGVEIVWGATRSMVTSTADTVEWREASQFLWCV